MLTLIKTLLVNITILFSFTFNANLFFPFSYKQSTSLKQKITYGFFGAFGALFCMLYPIETLGTTHFDLRMIAILITTLYAGFFPGTIVLMSVSISRFIISGPYADVGIAVNLLAFVTALVFRKSFLKTKYKFSLSALILLIYSTLYILVIDYTVSFLDLKFYIIYFSIFCFTFIALVFIIESLIRTNKQIEEMVYLDKLNMVGQMAASFAHEIRNPLATVRGFIQHLSTGTNDEQLKKFSPLILDELDRTNKIITNYLNVAKPEKFQLSIINLNNIIFDSVELLRPLASYSNTTISFKEEKSYFIKGDEQYLKQALMNVIKNGIESIHEQGQINIELQPDTSKNLIHIIVTDTGKGMAIEQLEKIGLPFYTTKTKGTGLGSMVTNKIVREMNGTIEYKSEPDKGTAVKISLPLTKASMK